MPGVAVALVSEAGVIWTGGFGESDVAEATPVTARTLFRANSVSKSFVALAVLRLVAEGRLSLDAPLREVAPEIAFENPWEGTHPVRVAHLLEHTTGFDDLHLREYAFGRDEGSLRDALAVNPAPRTARWPPGTYMAYNNGGYAVAAYLVEKVTGEPFEAFVRREVLAPAGMDDSGFGVENVDRALVSAHYLGGQMEPLVPYPLLIRPAGGLLTSAHDLGAFVHALLQREDSLVEGHLLTRMETPKTTDAARAGLRVGYGLGTYTAWGSGYLWHGHAGGTPSAYARYAYQPALGVGYALLMNGDDTETRRRLESAIQQFLIAGRTSPPPETPRAPSDRADYTGFYRQRTSNWKVTSGIERLLDVQRVEAAGGGLIFAPLLGDVPDTLLAVEADLFRHPEQTVPGVVFLRDARGEVTGLRTWDADNLRAGNYERTTALAAYAPPIVLVGCLLLMVSALVVAGARGLLAVTRRRSVRGGGWVRWLPPTAVLALVAALAVLVLGVGSGDAVAVLGRPTGTAVGFWLLLLCFAVLSLGALAVTVRALFKHSGPGRGVRVYAFLVALACTVVAAHLASWGLIGLQTWAF